MSNFIHLHCHSHYSLLDGLASPSEIADRAVELGQPAVAISDHGNMSGAIDFYTTCKERGIKPIIGLEAYVAPNSRYDKASKKGDVTAHHLTLLAKDEIGYKNLIQLATRGFTEGFYYKPRIDMELLKLHSKGLICLSGCIYSKFSRILLDVDRLGASFILGAIKELVDIFGDNDFYIECQDHGLLNQKIYKDYLLNNFPLEPDFRGIVATNDVHYLRQEDAKAQDALVCIGTGTHIYDEKRLRFPTDQLYMKSRTEMEQLFPREWLDRTLEIADKCNLEIPLHRRVHIHDPQDAFKRLKEECDGRIVGNPIYNQQYQERYQRELDAIQKTGYAEYLLVVADFIRFARSSSIAVGSGRGSSAGSLVCYLLGITEIDPIKYGLLFERFVNTERVEPPDIDVDISQAKRGEVIEYLKNEYGEDRVAQIISFGSMKAKATIRDVFRVLQLGVKETNIICKMIPEPYEGTVKDIFKEPKIFEYMVNTLGENKIKEVFEIAQKIEGRLRHSSTHAAGIVISDIPLINLVPLCKRENNTLTQYDMYSIEKLGLLKFDVLGLRTLDVIHEACSYLNINYQNIPLDDYYTLSQIRRGETFGIFQYEGYGYTRFIKRMQPQNFEHLISLGALYRPGTLNSGMADEYLNRMHDNKGTVITDEITHSTYGILLYQEQIMQAVVKYAGFTMNEADNLRKAIGKKDQELMDIMLSKIRNTELKNKIVTFARYGWNKAHAVSYALLSYYTAYLKFNHPTEFFCALLNSEIGDNERIQRIIAEACEYKVKISAPDINISTTKFELRNNTIYGGLLSIKGIGEKACEVILSEREKGQYKNTEDLRTRIPPKQLNSLAMKVLIESGCFREIK